MSRDKQMGTNVTDLDQMMKTLAAASADPNGVSVGDFAKAVQSLQTELKMLESEVNRLGDAVGTACSIDAGEIVEPAPKRADADHAAATKP